MAKKRPRHPKKEIEEAIQICRTAEVDRHYIREMPLLGNHALPSYGGRLLPPGIHLLDFTRFESACRKAHSQGKSMPVPTMKSTDPRTPIGSYAFTLILDSERNWELEELANAAYEAGFRDDVVGLENGKLTISMEREGRNYADAVVRGIKDVERAPLGLKAVNFYLECDANDEAETAEENDSILRAALVVRRRGPQVNRVVRELQGT